MRGSSRPIPLPQPITFFQFVLVVAFNTVFFIIFSVFLLLENGDAESCLATTENDHNFYFNLKHGSTSDGESFNAKDESNYVDVAVRFRVAFILIWLGHLGAIISAFLLLRCRAELAHKLNKILPTLTTGLIVGGNLWAIYARFVHSGRVCSGDYLPADEPPTPA